MAEKTPGLNVRYQKTEMLRSEADFTRYKGKFSGSCQQSLTLMTPKDLSADDTVLCDLDVIIGEKQGPIYIKVKIRSYFRVKKGIDRLTKEEQKHCQDESFEKASHIFAEFMKLHIGAFIPLPPPPEE